MGGWFLIQGLFSQHFSTHFSPQVKLDQPSGDTMPVGFLESMCNIRSVTEKHPLALGVISTPFKLAPHKAYMPVPACSCQWTPFPCPPRMDSQSGQGKFWASLIGSKLFSKAQGTEQIKAVCIFKTSILLSFWQIWPWSVFDVAEVITTDYSSTGHLHNASRAPPSHMLQKMGLLRQKWQTYKNLPKSEWTSLWFLRGDGPQS